MQERDGQDYGRSFVTVVISVGHDSNYETDRFQQLRSWNTGLFCFSCLWKQEPDGQDYGRSFVTAVISVWEVNKNKKTWRLRRSGSFSFLTLLKASFQRFRKEKTQSFGAGLFVFVGMARFELATPRPPDEYSKPCWATSRNKMYICMFKNWLQIYEFWNQRTKIYNPDRIAKYLTIQKMVCLL